MRGKVTCVTSERKSFVAYPVGIKFPGYKMLVTAKYEFLAWHRNEQGSRAEVSAREGVDRGSVARHSLAAHCWITLDNEVVLNPPDPAMVEILVYAGHQLRAPAPGGSQLAST